MQRQKLQGAAVLNSKQLFATHNAVAGLGHILQLLKQGTSGNNNQLAAAAVYNLLK